MSPYSPDFMDYVTYAEARHDNTVVLGDGTTHLHIWGKGTIKWWVEVAPHSHRLLILEDVLHVEGIKCWFLSASHFDQRRFTTTIGSSSLKIAKRNFSFSSFKIGTLYQCTMYAEKPLGVHSLSLVKKPLLIKMLHDCMGHLNSVVLNSFLMILGEDLLGSLENC